MVEGVRPVEAPARGLTVMIYERVAVCQQMIGEVAHHFPEPLPLGVCIRTEIIVEGVKEIVAVQFVAAGVGFPVPLAIGALWPAGFVYFPQFVALLFLAVAF